MGAAGEVIAAACGGAASLLMAYVAFYRQRTTVQGDAATREDDNVKEARLDERSQWTTQVAALGDRIARLEGRIDEQSKEIDSLRDRGGKAERRALVAEGRAMAMRHIAETAGADRDLIERIWARHNPANA